MDTYVYMASALRKRFHESMVREAPLDQSFKTLAENGFATKVFEKEARSG